MYVANKLRKSGSVSETVQARATSFSIQVDSTALDISASGLTVSIANNSTPKTLEITSDGTNTDDESCSWTRLGFREGDIVEIERASWNDGVLIRIDKFVENNTKIHYTVIKGPITNPTGSASGVTIYIKRILKSKELFQIEVNLAMLDILIEMYLYTKHSLIQKPELL